MKKVFITWHYTTHGIAYLKHILSAFYINKREHLEQEYLEHVFDTPVAKGFLFDEIVYLTAPQEAFEKISSRRRDKEDDNSHVSKERWRKIHHHIIKEQIVWLKEYSNFKKVYKPDIFKEEELKIKDLRDEREIAEKVKEWAKTYFKEENEYTIDISLGTSETLVVWYILAEKGILPKNIKFIKTYDNKLETGDFKSFNIKEAHVNLIQAMNINLFEKTKSKKRELAKKKMDMCLKSGFSILLIGERGTGKSQVYGKDIVKVNCASFEDNDKAEAELFGVGKGIYTGVYPREGAFKKADGGKLFLDEIHHLSKVVQAKLMTASGTDSENYMEFFPLGSKEKVRTRCQLIFATNKTIDELKKILLPDFYDRIVQNVIEIPSLKETFEDREQDWESVWEQMKFGNKTDAPKELIDWLKVLPLYGNFRDLEKIAIYYNDFKKHIYFDKELKKMIPEKTAFEYAKSEFEKWKSPEPRNEKNDIDVRVYYGKTADEIEKELKFKLQDWAIREYGGIKEAAERLGVSERTLRDWRGQSKQISTLST